MLYLIVFRLYLPVDTIIFVSGVSVASEELSKILKCIQSEVVTRVIYKNTALKLQLECTAFISSTRICSKPIVNETRIITYIIQPFLVPFNCFNKLTSNIYLPDLKPIKLRKITQHRPTQTRSVL